MIPLNSQEIFPILWNLKVNYHVLNNLLVFTIWSQIHTLPPHSSKIHFSIILTPRPGSFQYSLPLMFSKSYMHISSLPPPPTYTHNVPHAGPCHSSSCDHPSNIWKLLTLQFSLISCYSLLFRPEHPSLYSSLTMRDQVWHQHRNNFL